MPSTETETRLFDVVAVTIEGGEKRFLARGKTYANAEAIVEMAVRRRGVETEFYKLMAATEPAADLVAVDPEEG